MSRSSGLVVAPELALGVVLVLALVLVLGNSEVAAPAGAPPGFSSSPRWKPFAGRSWFGRHSSAEFLPPPSSAYPALNQVQDLAVIFEVVESCYVSSHYWPQGDLRASSAVFQPGSGPTDFAVDLPVASAEYAESPVAFALPKEASEADFRDLDWRQMLPFAPVDLEDRS